ncbi:MAG: hypothetical protein JNK05_01970 [Myxococcales bacterium]|nr:hypothetical protein [Myxococcales bacterium]
MNANVRALCVLRALALVGASSACTRNGTTDGTSANTQNGAHNSNNTQSANASIAGVSCGESAPGQGSSCEGHQIGHTCEWHSTIQCTCQQTPAGAKWSACAVRTVPGPLPPPELVS